MTSPLVCWCRKPWTTKGDVCQAGHPNKNYVPKDAPPPVIDEKGNAAPPPAEESTPRSSGSSGPAEESTPRSSGSSGPAEESTPTDGRPRSFAEVIERGATFLRSDAGKAWVVTGLRALFGGE